MRNIRKRRILFLLIKSMKLLSNYSIASIRNQNFGRLLFIFSLILLAIGLPLSPFLVSVSQFLLLFSWLIEGDFKAKFRLFKENKAIWIFLILPMLHIVWLLNTSDLSYALHDIKIKLPLLVFPLLLGTSAPLSKKEMNLVLASFILGVFSGSVVTLSIITGIYPYPHQNVRDTSIFISHIRFGLMVVFSLVLLGYYIASAFRMRDRKKAFCLVLAFIWFLCFLLVLQSITSWVVLFFLVYFLFIFYYKLIINKDLRLIGWGLLLILFVGVSGLIGKVTHDFYFKKNPHFSDLPTRTPRGNVYLNDTISREKENGYYVGVLICDQELSQTWPKLSQIPYDGRDANGYPVTTTMIRYLASKGLPKDEDGLLKLGPEDIKMIENGYASCVYRSNFIPYIRVYELIWELDRYFKNGDANNKSVAQRMEFSKAAIHIVSENLWFGVGTGDLRESYDDAYSVLHSQLIKENRLRAHNQYLTFFAAFGIFGFLLALFSLFGPAWMAGNRTNYLLASFLFIVFLSMLNEDTLETQAGVSFYIFFYSLLIFSSKNKQ